MKKGLDHYNRLLRSSGLAVSAESTRQKAQGPYPPVPKLEVAYDLDDDCHHWCPQRSQGGDLQRRSALSMADLRRHFLELELQRAATGVSRDPKLG